MWWICRFVNTQGIHVDTDKRDVIFVCLYGLKSKMSICCLLNKIRIHVVTLCCGIVLTYFSLYFTKSSSWHHRTSGYVTFYCVWMLRYGLELFAFITFIWVKICFKHRGKPSCCQLRIQPVVDSFIWAWKGIVWQYDNLKLAQGTWMLHCDWWPLSIAYWP